ncbi:MAG: UbiA prenyltransferase family protein [Bacilli bacterium]|nr:UbiA prenyltransferase family protein [Bacilli bacterium]
MKKNSKIKDYLKLVRINHYLKNVLIFLPIIFSGNLFNKEKLINVIIGFIIFSLISSTIYIINDIKDINNDKAHFQKKNRPLASETIKIKEAIVLFFILIIASIILIYFSSLNIKALLYIIIYIIINILYTFYLKNKPIVDITVLSSLFVIRVLYGAAIINVEVSNWLNLTIMSAAFYLALSKRNNELKNTIKAREVLKYYSNDYLNKNMYMFLSMAIIFYSLWTIDLKSVTKSSNYLIWTVPFIMIIALKYNMNIEQNKDDNPIEIVLNDKWLILLIAIYGIIIISILYIS